LQKKQYHSYHCISSPHTSISRRKRSMQCYGTWTLAGLCLSKPSPPDFNVIRAALPTLATLLQYCKDELVLKQACTTVACLSSGSVEKKRAILAAGICPRLVALLDDHNLISSSSLSSSPTSTWHVVQEAALRTLAIIMSGNPNHHPHQTQMVIQHVLDCNNGSLLPRLRALLDSPLAEIRRYTCWAVCNATSGQNNEQHIQAVIHYNIIPPLIHLFVHGDGDSREHAFLTVLNTLARGTAPQVQHIVQQGCIAPIVNLLMVSEPTMIRVALVALERILRVGQEIVDMSPLAAAGSNCVVPIIHTHTTTNPMAVLICQANGVEKIRQLRQLFAHDFICTQCTRILQVYFDEVEIMDIAPAA
jgi:importin subunit alpha-6/7